MPLVVYAILTEQNIAKLFAAAMVPGLLAMLGYIVVDRDLLPRCARSWRTPSEPMPWPSAGVRCSASGRSCVIFVVVFGGIYGGAVLADRRRGGRRRRHLPRRRSRSASSALAGIKRSFLGTAETSAMVFMIFLGADMMNAALALTQMPAARGGLGRRAAGRAAA